MEIYRVLGYRVEKFMNTKCEGENCAFVYSEEEDDMYILLLKDSKYKYELSLWEEEEECYSGWTTADIGCMKMTRVENFAGYTHIPIFPDLAIELPRSFLDGNDMGVKDSVLGGSDSDHIDIKNSVFSYSKTGGDIYYPCGHSYIEKDMFKPISKYPNPREKNHRLVWILHGDSASGKTYLSSKLQNLSVYETDQNKDLPSTIKESVIVKGNKYDHTLDDIKSKIKGDAEIIEVLFTTCK